MDLLITAILLLPLIFILQTTIHEGAHALVGMAFGRSVKAFRVIPHISNGVLYFGRVSWWDDRKELSRLASTLIYGAPFFVGAPLWLFWMWLADTYHVEGFSVLEAVLYALFAGQGVDLAFGWLRSAWAPLERYDWVKVAMSRKMPTGWARATGGMFGLFVAVVTIAELVRNL
jgi:hypothetical protein